MYYFSLVDGHAPGVEEGNTRISSKYTSGVGYMRPNLNCNCPCCSVLKKRRYFEQYLHPTQLPHYQYYFRIVFFNIPKQQIAAI